MLANLLKVSIKNKIALIEFNHQNKLNPLNCELRNSIKKSLLSFQANSNVSSIIITGSNCSDNNSSFSVGGDFNEILKLKTKQQISEYLDDVWDLYLTTLKIKKPIIAALDNYVIGLGMQLALACDLRIGTNRCIFKIPELENGISYTAGSLMLDYYLKGNQSNKLIYECSNLTARNLYDLHLLTKIVDPTSELINESFKLAAKLGQSNDNEFQLVKKINNKRFIQFLTKSIQDSKQAHIKSILNGENEKHFNKILNKF
jgi:enoyl-CoA hydratase/carnithine racemase